VHGMRHVGDGAAKRTASCVAQYLQPASFTRAAHDLTAQCCNGRCINVRSIESSKTPWCLHNDVEVPSMSCRQTTCCFNSVEHEHRNTWSGGSEACADRTGCRVLTLLGALDARCTPNMPRQFCVNQRNFHA
jgi:hypothetical protein